ncbi:MAG: 6-phosphogluconolactonase [Ignavibacteriaceae bacterium]|nr:6-phosphogluconolactonase [Ignavibacteriaceae bacterium]
MIDEQSVFIFNDQDELASAFLSLLKNENKKAESKMRQFNLALSGGETARNLFSAVARLHTAPDLLTNCNIFWADERCVPYNSPRSNFGNFMNTLGSKLNQDHVKFFPVPFTANPLKAADYYNLLLKSMLPHPSEQRSFDLLVLGAGTDGHTASIFPGKESLFSSENAAELVKSPSDGEFRVTITGELINFSALIVFLITGEEKSGIAADLIRRSPQAEKYPAFHVSPRGGKLIWFLDKAAASKI